MLTVRKCDCLQVRLFAGATVRKCYCAAKRARMSACAACTSSSKAVASRSSPGRSFTCRMCLPAPASKPLGSCSSAPRKKPTLTCAWNALTYADAASPTHAVGRMSIVQQLAHVGPAAPHHLKPVVGDAAQFSGILLHPRIDRRVACNRGRESHQRIHRSMLPEHTPIRPSPTDAAPHAHRGQSHSRQPPCQSRTALRQLP